MSGGADANGTWAYGLLEVLDGSLYSSVPRRLGAGVAGAACQDIGFPSGIEVDTRALTTLQGPAGDAATIVSVTCPGGGEGGLQECEVASVGDVAALAPAPSPSGVAEAPDGSSAAVLCSTPSGACCACLIVHGPL